MVLFIKNVGSMENTYQYGMGHEMGLFQKSLSSTETAAKTLTASPLVQYVNQSSLIWWTSYTSWKNWEMLPHRVVSIWISVSVDGYLFGVSRWISCFCLFGSVR